MTEFVTTLAVAVATLVALTLLQGGIAKLKNPHRVMRSVAGYDLLPDALVTPVGRVVPVAELLIASALLLWPSDQIIRFAAATLLLIFASAVTIALVQGRNGIDCGCGGTPRPIAPGLVVRNTMLALPLFLPVAELDPWSRMLTLVAGAVAFVLLSAFDALHHVPERGQ